MAYAQPGCKLFVGQLNYRTRDDELHRAFASFGNVVEAKVRTRNHPAAVLCCGAPPPRRLSVSDVYN